MERNDGILGKDVRRSPWWARWWSSWFEQRVRTRAQSRARRWERLGPRAGVDAAGRRRGMPTMSCIEHTGSAFLQPMRNVAGAVGLRQMQRDDTARCKILRPVRQSCRLIAHRLRTDRRTRSELYRSRSRSQLLREVGKTWFLSMPADDRGRLPVAGVSAIKWQRVARPIVSGTNCDQRTRESFGRSGRGLSHASVADARRLSTNVETP